MLGNSLKCAALVAILLSLGAVFATAAPPGPTTGKPLAAFELFRALAGHWVAAEDGEMFKKGTSSRAMP